jgi:hypothetical protein
MIPCPARLFYSAPYVLITESGSKWLLFCNAMIAICYLKNGHVTRIVVNHKFKIQWNPGNTTVVIIQVAEVLFINTTALSATRLLTFARRGANCCRGRDQLGPFVAL